MQVVRWIGAALMGAVWMWPAGALSQAPSAAQPGAANATILRAQARQSQIIIEELTDEIIQIDEDIERRIDKIIGLLTSVRDSTESNRKVINQKQDAMDALKRSLDEYANQRNMLQAELNSPWRRTSSDDIRDNMAVLDEKIETRIDQILAVTSSLTQHQDFQKYEYYQKGNSRIDRTGRRVSEEYQHSQRVGTRTSNTREDVVDALHTAIDELEGQNRVLNEQRSRTANEEQRAGLMDQIARNEEIISERARQIESTIMSEQPDTRPISSRDASSMDRLIQGLVDDIVDDQNTLGRLKSDLDNERQRLRNTQAQLSLMGG